MPTRITGLATGLDIDSIVKSSMKAYQTKIDQQVQKKDILEIQQKQYREIIKKAQDFYNKYLDTLGKNSLRKASNYTSVKFASSGTAVSAKGLAGAEATNYSAQVTQTAHKATYTIKDEELADIKSIRINGIDISTIKSESPLEKKDTETLVQDINKKLKEAQITNVKAKYSEFSKGIVIESSDTGRNAEFTLGLINDSGINTLSSNESIVNGVNADYATAHVTIEQLRGMDEININGVKVSLKEINDNPLYEGDKKKADYLNAVKLAIDKEFKKTDENKEKAVGVGIDTEKDRITLQAQKTGHEGFTLGEKQIHGTDGKSARMELDADGFRNINKLNVNDVEIDISAVNSKYKDQPLDYKDPSTGKTYIEALKDVVNNGLNGDDKSKTISGGINVATSGNSLVLTSEKIGSDKTIAVSAEGTTEYQSTDAGGLLLDSRKLSGLTELKINDIKVDISGIAQDKNFMANVKDKINEVLKNNGSKVTAQLDGNNIRLKMQEGEADTTIKVSTQGETQVKGVDYSKVDIDIDKLKSIKDLSVNGTTISLSAVNTKYKDTDLVNDFTNRAKYLRDVEEEIQKQLQDKGIDDKFSADISGNSIILSSAQPKEGEGLAEKINVSASNDKGANVEINYSNADSTFQGKNAIATLKNEAGEVYFSCSGKNTVTVDDVQFTFNDITKAGEDVKITGTNDATELKDNLVKFIDEYNKLIIDLNTAIDTKHNRNYSPLTADQKKEMSESEVKLWNEKVEEGQLYRDSDLSRITNALKSSMRSMMSDSGLRLENIGIKPVADYAGTSNGTFTVDEDALKDAIEANPEGVMNLFIGGSITNVTPGDGKTGILNQIWVTLHDEVASSASSLAQKVGLQNSSTFTNNTISNNIKDYEKKIKDMQTNFATKEQSLYSKYAQLETIMNKYNSQQSTLSSYFNS